MDFVRFNEEILKGKLHFLCSDTYPAHFRMGHFGKFESTLMQIWQSPYIFVRVHIKIVP